MNNKIYPEFIEDFKNYVAGIKNLSASYIDSMLSTLKGFLEFVNDHIFDCKYENINEMTLNDIKVLNGAELIVLFFGNIITMPGLNEHPSAKEIRIEDEKIVFPR